MTALLRRYGCILIPLAAAVLLLAVALAGCQGSGHPARTPRPAHSTGLPAGSSPSAEIPGLPTSSPTPTPTTPTPAPSSGPAAG